MKKNIFLLLLSFCTIILFTKCGSDIENCSIEDMESIRGCTDVEAINYDENAECDDDSCEYEKCSEKDVASIRGCTNVEAINYDDNAECDDNSCIYEKCSKKDIVSLRGCTDGKADNFNGNAECEDNSCTYTLTQEKLDDIKELVASVTGLQNGIDFSHDGTPNGGFSTIREIYTNIDEVVDNIDKGFVITKHVYEANTDGTKGNLIVTFAMQKHKEGYWAESNDWEYILMRNEGEVDYTINPNGLLTKASLSGNVHDQLPGCVSCHNIAKGGDQLFFND